MLAKGDMSLVGPRPEWDKHLSLSLDIKALLRTLWVVITERGAR